MKDYNTQYLQFKHTDNKPKTQVWTVFTSIEMGNENIGVIKWYAQWRQYCFFPNPKTYHNYTCLKDIASHINQLMAERKRG